MSDEAIEKLGTYFVTLEIAEKFGITFERFIQIHKAGTWGEYVK